MAWTKITEEMGSAVLAATKALLSRDDAGDLYALALYTADDGMSVGMAANTEHAYRAHLAAEAEEEENSAEDETYFRWASSEWEWEGWHDEVFQSVNTLLTSEPKDDFGSYFDQLIEAMTHALIRMKDEMGDELADVTTFITVTDSDAAEQIENVSAARINAPALARSFQSRFG